MSAGVSLLDQLRPPPGYRTSCAVGTTYSLDLVAAIATLVSLDGRTRDTLSFNVPSALRAMRNLKERVRIFAQQGCIHWSPKTRGNLVSLLDTVVRPVPFDLNRQSFHPKVWLVRQDPVDASREDAAPARFVLVVGSRNLTQDTSWDLGMAIEGTAAKRTNVRGIKDFVEYVCGLGGDASFSSKAFEDVDTVEWTLPKGIGSLRFAWHAGDGKRRTGPEGHPGGLPVGRRLLVLTPFLDSRPVKQLAARWSNVSLEEKRLVGGLDHLQAVAAHAPEELASLNPVSLDLVADLPIGGDAEAPEASAGEGDSDPSEERGLHAKAIAVWVDKTATVLLGSANLTSRAWDGDNCEAWEIAEGATQLAEALWNWAGDLRTGLPFDPTLPSTTSEAGTELDDLERLHRAVSASAFCLDEIPGPHARLRAAPPLSVDREAGFLLDVARASTPSSTVVFSDPESVELAACQPEDRTQFVVMRLRGPTMSKRWVQVVQVVPPMEAERDARGFARLLGPEQFLQYLRDSIDGADPDDVEEGDGGIEHGGNGVPTESRGARPLRLESLLHAVGRALNRGRSDVLLDLDRAIRDYRSHPEAQSGGRLAELFRVWSLVSEGMK